VRAKLTIRIAPIRTGEFTIAQHREFGFSYRLRMVSRIARLGFLNLCGWGIKNDPKIDKANHHKSLLGTTEVWSMQNKSKQLGLRDNSNIII
jgi:hypothetical protein